MAVAGGANSHDGEVSAGAVLGWFKKYVMHGSSVLQIDLEILEMLAPGICIIAFDPADKLIIKINLVEYIVLFRGFICLHVYYSDFGSFDLEGKASC